MFSSVRFTASRSGRAATACAVVLGALIAPAASLATSGRSDASGVSLNPLSSLGSFSRLSSLPAFGAGGPSGGGGLPSPSEQSDGTKAPPGAPGKGNWIGGYTITEYWATPESWFKGKLVKAPGLPGKHRIDWLYSAMGVSMEGDGIGLDGRRYHIDSLGNGGWVTAAGKPTSASNGFRAGSPYWRAGAYWRNAHGGVTFPLSAGGWDNGTGKHYVPLRGVSFASGPSLPLHALQSIAVDPSVIPLGSRVYIPAYKDDGHGGWFVAQDTGGAINDKRIDVYRRPPSSPGAGGQYLTSQRIYVVKP
jgi:3D domain